jgi:hypothetical protein
VQCSSKLISRGSKSPHNHPNQEQSVEESRKHEAKGPIKDQWLKPSQGRQKGKAKERPKDAQPAQAQKEKKKARKHNIMCSCKLHVIYIHANLTAIPHRATFSTVHTYAGCKFAQSNMEIAKHPSCIEPKLDRNSLPKCSFKA